MPKISVIVPVYNVEPYIRRCVDSILNQTFTDFELILIDDGSPDNCGKICDEYAKRDNRVIVIHQENGGASAARNTGIDWAFNNSNSEWITFVDSDDFVHEQYLDVLFDLAISNNVSVSCCAFEKVTDDFIPENKHIDLCNVKVGSAEELYMEKYTSEEFDQTTIWGRLYKKDLFRNIRYPVGKSFEDEYVTYKILFPLKSIAIIISPPLYFYFQNKNGLMHADMTAKSLCDYFDALEQKMHFFYENNSKPLFQSVLLTYISNLRHFYYEYYNNTELSRVIRVRNKSIYKTAKRYNEYIPSSLTKNDIKSICKKIDKDLIIKDFKLLKNESGLVYAIIWTVKHLSYRKQ